MESFYCWCRSPKPLFGPHFMASFGQSEGRNFGGEGTSVRQSEARPLPPSGLQDGAIPPSASTPPPCSAAL